MKHAILAIFVALLCVSGLPVRAEAPLTGPEFEALVEGKTLTFATDQAPYGVEYYAPGRRVIWSFIGGECVNGTWYDVATDTGTNICFSYENDPEPQCWQIYEQEGSLRAVFMNRPGTTVLYEAVEAEPLVCGGAGV